MTDNQLADELNLQLFQSHEWELDQNVFLSLCHKWGHPSIDMFATPFNKKCDKYASCAGKGEGSLGDAFMVPWNKHLLYLFPLIPIIQRALVRALQMEAEAIIAPW